MTNTQIYKGRDGWRAKTEMDLPGITLNEGMIGETTKQGMLTISTSKTSRGLETGASVAFRDGRFMTHRLYQDFNARFAASDSRCTEKAIRTMHDAALAKLPTILECAYKHYGLPVPEESAAA